MQRCAAALLADHQHLSDTMTADLQFGFGLLELKKLLLKELPTVLKNVGECYQIVAKEVHFFLPIDSEEYMF
jgi:hypothetical protein